MQNELPPEPLPPGVSPPGLNLLYETLAKTPTYRRIWQEVYGAEYPEEAEPFGFVTRTGLHRIAQALHLHSGQTFLDVGCGQGGPGLWVARETEANVLGIDLSEVAIQQARERAERWDLPHQATFLVGNAIRTTL
jgi:2-polyprenyl-3-methyl-5-hydroxy-6-metoxy-1,4-benzoquinol methylase